MPRRSTTRARRRPSLAAQLRPEVEKFLAARRAWHAFVLPDSRTVGSDAFERACAEDARLERAMRQLGYDVAYCAALALGLDTTLPTRPVNENDRQHADGNTAGPENDRAARGVMDRDGAGRSDTTPAEQTPRDLQSTPFLAGA